MRLGGLRQKISQLLGSGHGDVRSFEHEIEASGAIVGRSDRGYKEIPTTKIVGSVGRAQNLRSDFFYKSGRVTARFTSIGRAMAEGRTLPPLEVYKVKMGRPANDAREQKPVTEYYVVDGHHRVAMAKKLGQDYLDAHVVEYRLAPGQAPPSRTIETDSSAEKAAQREAEPAKPKD
jgi:hypothetical protein